MICENRNPPTICTPSSVSEGWLADDFIHRLADSSLTASAFPSSWQSSGVFWLHGGRHGASRRSANYPCSALVAVPRPFPPRAGHRCFLSPLSRSSPPVSSHFTATRSVWVHRRCETPMWPASSWPLGHALLLLCALSEETIYNCPCKDQSVAQTPPKAWGLGGKEGVVPLRKGNSLPQGKSIGLKTLPPLYFLSPSSQTALASCHSITGLSPALFSLFWNTPMVCLSSHLEWHPKALPFPLPFPSASSFPTPPAL